MSFSPQPCILDASTGIKLVLKEDHSDLADGLLRHVESTGGRFHVPDLFYTECSNILWKRVQRKDISEAQAATKLEFLLQVVLDVTATQSLARLALKIALSDKLSAYDACYVALAHQTGLPLVTADGGLVRKAASHHPILWLGDLKL